MSKFKPGAHGSEYEKFWWNCVCGGCQNYAEITLPTDGYGSEYGILLYIEQEGPLKKWIALTPQMLVDCIHWDGLDFGEGDTAASIELDVEIEVALTKWLTERGVVLPKPSDREGI